MIIINAQIIFFALHKLIAIRIEFHMTEQCAIMSEITSNCNGCLFHNDCLC